MFDMRAFYLLAAIGLAFMACAQETKDSGGPLVKGARATEGAAKATAGGVKKAATATADVTSDAASATASGVKKTGKKTAEVTAGAAGATADATRATGSGIKRGVKKVVGATGSAIEKTGGAMKRAGGEGKEPAAKEPEKN